MAAPCPISGPQVVTQAPAAPQQAPINDPPDYVGLVAGRTQMMIGANTITVWNPTTKQFETMSRPTITSGTNGGKVFTFGQSKLI